MRKLVYCAAPFLLTAAVLAGLARFAVVGQAAAGSDSTAVGRPPRLQPDYVACTIPPNIAPLNFRVQEPGTAYVARLSAVRGEPVEISSRDGRFAIPIAPWRRLLADNRGEELSLDVRVRTPDGGWTRYETVGNRIARDGIDGYLTYRLLGAAYNVWMNMRICQRNLETFEESVVLDNSGVGYGCVNCHTFLANGTSRMAIQLRPGSVSYGSGMLLIQDGAVTKVDARSEFNRSPAVYLSWHPSGRVLAFSANKIRQFFHSAREEIRDVVDLQSDLGIYLPESNTVTSTAAISRADRLETYPSWSPDGKYLYFCSAPVLWSDPDKVPPERYDHVRYDLMRVSYDLDKGTWGEVETVLSAQETGKSITLPRISPDGRFLVFTMADYGCFPIYQASADLYMMDLKTKEHTRLGLNSDRCDSWHSWSSNGRWLVFSSKRLDGLLARPFFAYVDEDGNVGKPFLLPQEDPGFYDGFLQTYNVPELTREAVPIRGERIARAARSEDWVRVGLATTSATPRAGAEHAAASAEKAEEPWKPVR